MTDKPGTSDGIIAPTGNLPESNLQEIQNTFAKLRDDLLKNKSENFSLSMTEFVGKWGEGFTYYMIIVVILVNVSLYVDVFVENSKAILGVHLTRIIFLLSVLIISIVSLVKGWQSQEIPHSVNIVTKLLYLVIMLGYFIAMAVKLSRTHAKIGENIFRLIVSIALVVVGVITFIGAITLFIKNDSNDPATISMYYLLIVSVLGIVLSIISIVKAQTRSSDIPDTPIEPPNKEPPIKEPPKEPPKEPIILQPPSKEPPTGPKKGLEKKPEKGPNKEPEKGLEKKLEKKAPSVKPTFGYRGRTPPRPKSPGIPVEPVGIEQSVKKERERLLSPKK